MRISEFTSWTMNDNEIILINTQSKKCVILDEIGGQIWDCVIEGKDECEIVDFFKKKFHSTETSKINTDVRAVIRLLIDNCIIKE